MKYSKELKLECVHKYLNGEIVDVPDNATGERAFLTLVRVWAKKYVSYGEKCFDKGVSRATLYSLEEKLNAVGLALAGESVARVSLETGIQAQLIYNWRRQYLEKGSIGLQYKKKGRKLYKSKMSKQSKKKLTLTEKEELKYLRERNRLLEIEVEYLKKLDALVSKREAEDAKAKNLK